MRFKPLEQLERKYEIKESESNDSGYFGKIYRLDDGNVVKIPYDKYGGGNLLNNERINVTLHREAKVQTFANKMDLSFPEVKGIYAIKGKESGAYFPGLVMEDLGDTCLEDLEGEVLKEANRQYDEQKSTAKDIGFIMQDRNNKNAMWKDGRTRMCDAGKLKVDNGIN